MFTDIEGFTAYTNREGDVAAAKMMAEHDGVLKKAIADNDGLIIQKIGDAFLAVFADPSLSVKAALAIQQELKKIKFILKVRIGIHLGQIALLQSLSTDIFGNHVNIASRIETLAKGGQIFLSRTVYDSAHSWVRSEFIKYKYHGKAKLKGIEGKEDIYQVGMEGDDFSIPSIIISEKRKIRSIITATVTALILIPTLITLFIVKSEKDRYYKNDNKILIEMWSSNLNHLIPISEEEVKIWPDNSFSTNRYPSKRKSIRDVVDTTLIKEFSDSSIKKLYLDFKLKISENFEAKEIEKRFVFEDDLIEKGFLDTFEIGNNIPLPILQSIGCDAFFFCELFQSPGSDTLYYYKEYTPHQLFNPNIYNCGFGMTVGTTLKSYIFIDFVLRTIKSFGFRTFPLGKIIHVHDDICYIRNEYRVEPSFIGSYISISKQKGNTSYSSPFALEVKTITDSIVTAQIIERQVDSDSNWIISIGDEAFVIIQDIYSYDPQEICSYWYWYAEEIGRSLISQGKYREASKVYGDKFRKILEKQKDAGNLNVYAWSWALTGKNLESALKAAKKSLELKETDNSWDTLSLVYWKMGKYQEALEAEEKALQLAGGKDKDYEKRISDIKADMEKKGKKVKG
jgi:hypothetical protein